MPAWWPSLPSFLLKNVTPGAGNWLRVRVVGGGTVNRMGIGAKVYVYAPGGERDPTTLVGCSEIVTGYGYASAQQAVAHFGLGSLSHCDVAVFVPGRTRQAAARGNVAANQTLVLRVR